MQQGPVLKICTISCQLILLVVGISACTSMLDYGSWNKPSSIQALRQLVKEGDVAAGTALGQKYEMGQGVRQDLKQAKNWYIKASKGGDPLAMFLLGQLLEFGLSDSPDYEQAAIYYAAAAELGHAEAQARLARFYEEGWGVPQSFEMANKWYSLATLQWNSDQRVPLGSNYATGRNIAKHSTYTIQRFQRAAQGGVAEAQFDLANAYETGNGVPADTIKAEKWYRVAADQGHERAREALKRFGETTETQTQPPPETDQPHNAGNIREKASASSDTTTAEKQEFLAVLSSYRSLELASADTLELSKNLAKLLTGLAIRTNRVDLPVTGRLYRVEAGPFTTRSSAKNFCAQVLRRRTYCRVLNVSH
ncbi:MAG: SPOR domain-containing protein [Pseudomonadota bacterium]|nr:SPOR domain-containing protein [Pseudomonadota bacterium]